MSKPLEALLRQIQKTRVQDKTPLDQEVVLKVLAADTRWKPTSYSTRYRPLFEYTGRLSFIRTGPVGYRFISNTENPFILLLSTRKGWSIRTDKDSIEHLAAAIDNYTFERPVEARLYIVSETK